MLSRLLLRAFDCHLISQAWNTQTSAELSLSGPVGQVYAMVVGNSMLLAGTQVNNSTL